MTPVTPHHYILQTDSVVYLPETEVFLCWKESKTEKSIDKYRILQVTPKLFRFRYSPAEKSGLINIKFFRVMTSAYGPLSRLELEKLYEIEISIGSKSNQCIP